MTRLPLLFLPGLMCDEATWAPQVAALRDLAETRVIDHGAIDTLPGMARALLGNAPPTFALAGHSMGGRVALEVVRQAPERVSHLALLDTGYQALPEGKSGEDERAGRQRLLDLAQREGMRAMAQQWVQHMVHPDRLDDASLMDDILAMFQRKTPTLFAGQIRALLNRPDAEDVLRALQCPTLVLCGEEDSWSPPARHAQISTLVPHSRLVVVPHCGHMAPLEQPVAVNAALREWLA